MNLYTLGFLTKSYGRGVAIVAAHDANEAYTVLVSYGQLNHTPEEYGEILDIKNSGCSSFDIPTLLEEELTAIKVITGEPGNDGKSIYELCVKNGTFEGTEEEFVAKYNAAVSKAESAINAAETAKSATENTVKATSAAISATSEAVKATTNANNAIEKAENTEATLASNEETRIQNENIRKENETTRQTTEGTRVYNEKIRVSNEESRVKEESSRVTAETSRKRAEELRVSQEETRVSEETKRADAESVRVSSEESRVKAENSRVTAELGRVSAEEGRVKAEDARVTEFNSKVKEVTTATSNATAATSAAQTATTEAKTATTDANAAAKAATEAKEAIEKDTAVVKTSAQELTDEQAAQARENIGASGSDDKALSELLLAIVERLDALEARIERIGNATAGILDVKELRKNLYPLVLRGHGVPAAATIPVNLPDGLPWDGVPPSLEHRYVNLDASANGDYYPIGTESVSDWKKS